jgi:ATP-dependent Lhr-like helicase
MLVERLGPVGRAFFGRRFQKLTEIQRQAIAPIMAGENLLVAAATASGKTEALCAPLVARLCLFPAALRTPGIRMLVVAPTRALVNDLFARLSSPLADLGWAIGRQTSDHRDKLRQPNVLITTPESLDSMLVRDGMAINGRTVGHLLAGVEAVFIDEVHLFVGTSRGDQLIWLLERLRRLRRFAAKHGLAATGEVQVCGGSATVASPEQVAQTLLGTNARALTVPGFRPLEIFRREDETWTSLEPETSVTDLRNLIALVTGKTELNEIAKIIWCVLRKPQGSEEICRKLLVFVPTRRLCDQLSVVLLDFLTKHRAIHVFAHHGSLERMAREHAETGFAVAHDAVLVATTTLEVGIDIGNVDAVVLVGPPPDTGSLLQRVGRAGRRSGITRILPIARDQIERAAFCSLLVKAHDGTLDETQAVRRWSVYVQQSASYIAQAPKKRRSRESLLELAQSVWPNTPTDCNKAARILDHLCREDYLVPTGDNLSLGDDWSDRLLSGGGAFHSNLDEDRTGRPVVDISTGEVIAHVQGSDTGAETIHLGGQRWILIRESGEILLKSTQTDGPADTMRYGSRRAPTRYAFARHVLAGLGFELEDAPVMEIGGQRVWWHCGGSAYERVLLHLLSDRRGVSGLEGLAINHPPEQEQLKELARQERIIREIVSSLADSLATVLTPGPWQASLPDDVRREVVTNLFGVERFIYWLQTRRLKMASML